MSETVVARTLQMYGIGLALYASASAFAQCPEPLDSSAAPPLLHARARSVLVDVVIAGTRDQMTDRSAFHLYEDGKLQALSSFDFHSASARSTGEPGVPSPFDPVGEERSNRSVSRVVAPISIILIDRLNTSMVDQQRSRKQIITALQALPPGQPVALFTMGTELRMIQGPTERSDVLIAAAAKLSARSSPLYNEHSADQIREDNSLSGADFRKQALSLATIKDPVMKAQLASRGIDNALAEQGTRRMDVRVASTISSLQRLAHFVQEYPGRKRLIWISGSFPISLRPDAAGGLDPNLIREYTPRLQQLDLSELKPYLAESLIELRISTGMSASVYQRLEADFGRRRKPSRM